MITDTRPLRSVLFLPASNARAIEKARTLACDALVLDLEDAVAPDAKDAARDAAVNAVREGFGKRVVAVRCNLLDSPWGAADFAAISTAPVDAIVVPKVESVAEAKAAVSAAAGKPVWVMIETPRGVLAAPQIAEVQGIAVLIAGVNDLAKELHAVPGRERGPLLHSLSAIVLAARAYGRLALDGVHGDIADLDALAFTSAQGAAMGFDGRTIIHPTHIEAANCAYAPSPTAIENARGLIAAFEAGRSGVITFRGQMIEALHVEEARRVMARAGLDA